MSVVYNGIHSVTFIESSQSISAGQTLTSFTSVRNTWNSFHLVPANRPYVSPMEPKIQLVTDTVSSKVFDITDAVAGGMTYSARKGSWDFLVDHDKWSNWYTAKQTIEDYLNGKRRYCFLNGDDTLLYCGRFKVSGWEDGTQYPKITIEYDLDYETYALSANLNRPTSLSVSWKSSAPTVYEHQKKDTIRNYLNATISYGGYYTGSCDIDVIEGSFSGTGSQTITVSYTANDLSTFETIRLTASINITVSADYLKSITVNVDPNVRFYNGDLKDKVRENSTIVRHYASGISDTIAGTNANSLSGTIDGYGDYQVQLTYSSKTVTVTVFADYLESISVSVNPNVKFYHDDSKNKVRENSTIVRYYASGITDTIAGTNADGLSGRIPDYGDYQVQLTYSGKTATVTVYVQIEYTWECLEYAIAYDKYHEWFEVGDEFPLEIKDEYNGYAQIVAIDGDADEYGESIPVTFITKNLLQTDHNMNSTATITGGYPASGMRSYINDLIFSLPFMLQRMIVAANKTSVQTSPSSKTLTTALKLWIPSCREIFGDGYGFEDTGVIYSTIFKDGSSRIKCKSDGYARGWWLRSVNPNDAYKYGYVGDQDGHFYSDFATYTHSIALGFCVSYREPNIYLDETWEGLDYSIRCGCYRDDYRIGDMIPLQIGQNGSEYDGYAEIVAIDTDVDANGNTIPLTFITKNLLNTSHNMNATDTSEGGYPASDMKTYIDGLKSSLPSRLQSMIVAANKTSAYETDDHGHNNDLTNNLELWIPSEREILGAVSSAEENGVIYSSIFKNKNTRKKSKVGGSTISWWLRTRFANDCFLVVSGGDYGGDAPAANASSTNGIALGFCVGPSQS